VLAGVAYIQPGGALGVGDVLAWVEEVEDGHLKKFCLVIFAVFQSIPAVWYVLGLPVVV
jgi:hypothetical protein